MGEGLKKVAKLCGGLVARDKHGAVAHPPPADLGLQNTVIYVDVPPGKRVVWTHTHTAGGSFVSGYTLVKENER